MTRDPRRARRLRARRRRTGVGAAGAALAALVATLAVSACVPARRPAIPASALPRHPGPIDALSVRHARLVTGGSDGTAQVWSLAGSGHERSITIGAPVRSVSLAPNGSTLAVLTGRGEVVLFDAATGRRQRTFAAPGTEVVEFSHDGRSLVAGGRRVVLWELSTGQTLLKRAVAGQTGTAALSVDAGQLALVGGGRVQVLRTFDASPVWSAALEGRSPSSVYTAAFSPNGRWLAVGGEAIVWLFDAWASALAHTGALSRILERHSGYVTALAFSPVTGDLATVSQGAVLIWHPETGDLLERLQGHPGQVTRLAFAADGSLVSADQDGGLRRWDPATGRELALGGAQDRRPPQE